MTTIRKSGRDLVVFITVRSCSARLPAKCFMEFGDGTVLDHVIARAKFFSFVPIICTTDSLKDDEIQAIASRHGVGCFRGSERDKLKRWADACRVHKVARFHTVDADDPFFDGQLVRESMELLLRGGFDVVYPSEETYLASVGYSLTADAIFGACALKTNDDTEMMWYYLEKVPGLRKTRLIVPDAAIREVRLTLDYAEDYWLLRTVLRLLGPYCTRKDIEALFLSNPRLAHVNWFRNEEWKKRQMEKAI